MTSYNEDSSTVKRDEEHPRSVAERSDDTGSPPERSDGGSPRKSSTPTKTSRLYGEAVKQFSWSYKVDALPIPAASASPVVKARGYGDGAIKGFLRRIFRDLETYQGHAIEYAFAIETGESGWRHPHLLLGRLSRLAPAKLEAVFREHRFGKINVEIWDRGKENGYMFKSLDRPTRPGEDYCWETSVVWNKVCRNRMKLCRKHLGFLVDTGGARSPLIV